MTKYVLAAYYTSTSIYCLFNQNRFYVHTDTLIHFTHTLTRPPPPMRFIYVFVSMPQYNCLELSFLIFNCIFIRSPPLPPEKKTKLLSTQSYSMRVNGGHRRSWIHIFGGAKIMYTSSVYSPPHPKHINFLEVLIFIVGVLKSPSIPLVVPMAGVS